MKPIPARGDDDFGPDAGEDLFAGGGREDEEAAVDSDAHGAEERDGRVAVEEHGEHLAAEHADHPVPDEDSCDICTALQGDKREWLWD